MVVFRRHKMTTPGAGSAAVCLSSSAHLANGSFSRCRFDGLGGQRGATSTARPSLSALAGHKAVAYAATKSRIPVPKPVAPPSWMARLNSCQALVVDSSYLPIDVVNWQRAVCLALLNRVDVLEYYDLILRSAYEEHPLPAVVRVRRNVLNRGGKRRYRVALTRRNIMLRDNYTCQYCGSQHDLTIDHVHPLSKGGSRSWDNLTTACARCNGKKGDKLLGQSRMKLKTMPKEPAPTAMHLMATKVLAQKEASPKEWEAYLQPFKAGIKECAAA